MSGRRHAQRVRLRSEAVWDWLNRRNVSQNDLAVLLGVSSGHLSRLINGRRSPSPRMRRSLMETLGCAEFDDLFIVVKSDE